MIRFSWPVLLSLAVAGCGQRDKPPVFIGQIVSWSGNDKSAARSKIKGVRLAVDELRKDKQFGQPVVVLHVQADSRQAAAGEAVRLHAVNQVSALLDGSGTAVAERINAENLPVISSGGYRGPSLEGNVFRTGLSPALKGEALGALVVSNLLPALSANRLPALAGDLAIGTMIPFPLSVAGANVANLVPKRIVLLVDQRDESNERAAESFSASIRQHANQNMLAKLPRIHSWSYTSENELEEKLERIAAARPDLVFLAGPAGTAWKIRKSAGDASIPLLVAGEIGSQVELGNSDLTNHDIYLVTAWVAEIDTAANKEFKKTYSEQYKQPPNVFAALAYDNARLLFAALKKCDFPVTGKQLIEQLDQLKDYPALFGKTSFSKERVLERPAFVVRLRGGSLQTVLRHEPKNSN